MPLLIMFSWVARPLRHLPGKELDFRGTGLFSITFRFGRSLTDRVLYSPEFSSCMALSSTKWYALLTRKSSTQRWQQRPWPDLGWWFTSLGIHGSHNARIYASLPTCQMTPCFSTCRPCSMECQEDDSLPENTVSITTPLG
jgi:hypothetical protein